MTVKDIMQQPVSVFSEDASIKEVVHAIFSTSVSSFPILKGKKIVGILSEEDIMRHLDSDSKLNTVLVKEIMTTDITTILPDAPLEELQEIMLKQAFSRIPVVDKDGNLIGIVSQGDVFREVIKEELPEMNNDQYAEFISEHYDMMINWPQRFEAEFPSLLRVFRRDNVHKVLDVGVWTGIFSIGLSKEGVHVTGLERNKFLLQKALNKKAELSQKDQENIDFKLSDYTDISRDVEGTFDSVICLGNSLLYLPGDLENIFKGMHKVLRDNDGSVILQILNTSRVLNSKDRLLNFQIQKSKQEGEEHLFLEFLDKKDEKTLNHNLVVFEGNGERWVNKGTTTVPVRNIDEKDIVRMLTEAGFSDISVSGYQSDYQGEYSPISFIKPFDQKTSDWLVVFARKA